MTDYYIAQEFHTMPAVPYGNRPGHAADFHYAIRRSHDKSLVFRASDYEAAEDLLARLAASTRVAA